MKASWVALLLVLAVPLASAQLPVAPSACGPLSIPTAPASPDPIAAGQTADVLVDVTNGGQIGASVTVTAAVSATGWTIRTSPPAASIAAGQTATFVIVVEAADGATGPAIVQIAASGTCETPLPTCPGNACVAGSANTQVEVPFQADEGFRLPGLGDFPLEYLIAGVVLVGLATAIPFAMRRKKTGIVAECPEPLKMVRPGRGTSFPIEIKNASKDAATAQFEVGPVPEGWSAFMPLPEVQLAPREARSLWLMVRSPASAAQGEAVEVELRLRDATKGGNGRVVRVRAEVQGSAEG